MSKREIIYRYFVFIIGLFFSGIGVAFTKSGQLGVTPISSVSNILSIRFDSISIGTWLIIWNCVMILGQILILRKDFKIVNLLQIPLSFLFGWFTDFGMWICSFIPVNNYPMKLVMLLLGISILAFGISISIMADVILNSGEAIVKAISDKTGYKFGNVKVVFDVSTVTLSIIMSLFFFNFKIVGTREGTIISALLTGQMVKVFNSFCNKFRAKIGL